MFTRLFLKLSALALLACSGAAMAQSPAAFPSRPITLIVPFGPGGSTDLTSRAIGNALSKSLGQPVVVENKPGGSGAVAVAALRQKPADGYTLMVMGSSLIANQHLSDVNYDVQRDFVPVTVHMSYNAGLVVRSDAPFKTLGELTDYAKANPGKVSYSGAAAGTPTHLAMMRVALARGLDLVFVPYGDGVKAVAAVLGGHTTAASQVTEWKPHVEQGTLRLLATYGKKRMPQFPQVPTLRELGYDIEGGGFNAIVVPAGTPPDHVAVLAKALQAALSEPNSEFAQLIGKFDLVAENMPPQQAAEHIRAFDAEVKALAPKLRK